MAWTDRAILGYLRSWRITAGPRLEARVYPRVASFPSSAHRDPSRAFSGPSYMSYEDGMPAGGNSRFRGYPARMSERQQLALLLQMTSQEIVPGEMDKHFVTNEHAHNFSTPMQEHVIDHPTMLARGVYVYVSPLMKRPR